jgi:hypothetical protein
MEKRHEEFSIERAFEACSNMRNVINQWEQIRTSNKGVS